MNFRLGYTSARFISLSVRDYSKDSFKFNDLNERLVSPDKLKAKPDVKKLQFGKHFTDHMLKIEYYDKKGGWQAPVICPLEYLSLHPASKVFHYAIELFEGLKAYRGKDGKVRIFRPDLNMARMNITAERARLPTFESEELIRCISRLISIDSEWVPHSEFASLYIRPTLIGTEPTLGINWSDSALLYVILSPVGSYFDSENKLTLLADPKFVRAWPGGVGDRKMGSNYAPTIQIQKNAANKGFQQVLWLYGSDQQITEAGTMNFFLVYINENGEKEMVTPPLDGLILPGITRQSILELAKEWNEWKVTERKVTMDEVVKLSNENRLLEIFGAGTACVVSPVEAIFYDGKTLQIPTAKQKNSIHSRLLKVLTDIQYGVVDHSWARVIE